MTLRLAEGRLERAAAARGARRVVGVDEVGRGPLAGPVTAAAVCLDMTRCPDGLADSKVLSPQRRAVLFEAIHASATVSVAHAEVGEIDALNILGATELAMCRAVAGLAAAPDLALVDGDRVPRALPCAGLAIVRGDARSLSIAAASIAAKVVRDRLMVALAAEYPGYGWETNMGYAAPAHRAVLRLNGPTPHHRRSFAPVRAALTERRDLSG